MTSVTWRSGQCVTSERRDVRVAGVGAVGVVGRAAGGVQ